jgi:hypothetical protein
MADGMRLEIKGVPELVKALQAAKADVEQAVAASMLASAFIVSNDAKRRAPRLTGNLARSITPGVGTDPLGSSGPITQTAGTLPRQTVGTIRADLQADGKADAFVATNVVYAPPQEFLHKPFLRPALDENHGAVQDEFREGLTQALRRAQRGA